MLTYVFEMSLPPPPFPHTSLSFCSVYQCNLPSIVLHCIIVTYRPNQCFSPDPRTSLLSLCVCVPVHAIITTTFFFFFSPHKLILTMPFYKFPGSFQPRDLREGGRALVSSQWRIVYSKCARVEVLFIACLRKRRG